MYSTWNDAQFFMAVAQTGSFSAAARALGVKQPTVSRRIAALEEHTGGPLFYRGRRGAQLTAAGARLLPAARAMAHHAQDFSALLDTYSGVAEGTVRIAAPPGVSLDVLAPFARHLRDIEPGIRLEILSDTKVVDLTRGDADLALRTQMSPSRYVECLWKYEVFAGAYVSPEYKASLPAKPALTDIGWITFCHPFDHLPPGPQLAGLIEDFTPVFSSTSFVIQLEAAANGVGAIFLPRGLHEARGGRSLVFLETVELPTFGNWIYLVAPERARWVPRVKAVAEALMQYLDALVGKFPEMKAGIREAAAESLESRAKR